MLSNRGVNGIDGVISSALGVSAGQSAPVVALVGDLAFLHDASALVALGDDAGGSCTLVVLDNGGGGIFSFLPQATELDAARFEQLFGTTPQVSVASVGRGFGLQVEAVSDLAGLDAALDRFVGRSDRGLVVVEVPGRAENRLLHDRLHAAVAEVLGASLGW